MAGNYADRMDNLQRLLAPLAAYPRWLVITCLVLVALAAFWLLTKVIKWTIFLVLAGVVLLAVLVAFGWFLG
jgi:uncharacterized RDD family membrane protein YckC